MNGSYLLRTFAALSLFALYVTADAQQPGPSSQQVDWSKQLRIKKIVGTGRQTMVKTPAYTTSVSKSPTREQDWYQFWVQYETAHEWIDEVVFTYHVLAQKKVNGKDAYSLYRKTIKYIDVPQARGHMSTAYLRPNTIKRYGEIVAAAVEVSVNGQPAAEHSEWKATPKTPEKWWKNPAIVESPAVTVRDGYLLDRSQTPFAFINVDDYGVIK